MSCSSPVSWEELVRYWARDLDDGDDDRLEEHLMGCAACSAESARVATVALALRAFIPPIVTREILASLRERGLRIEEKKYLPRQRQTAHFRAGLDVLILRLTGFDLSRAERVGISVRAESTGEVLMEDTNVPFDAEDGVLIACQRHFASAPHDILFELRASGGGTVRSAIYLVPHVFE